MSTDTLRDEHEALRARARDARREFAKSPASPFVREMREAIKGYLQMRAEGVSREDACKGLEEVLRGYWPKPTTKFPTQCGTCEDAGWQMRFCTDALRCERRWCRQQHPAHEHVYVEPCSCAAGDRLRARVLQVEDEIAAVGRMQKRKPRGWSQAGG